MIAKLIIAILLLLPLVQACTGLKSSTKTGEQVGRVSPYLGLLYQDKQEGEEIILAKLPAGPLAMALRDNPAIHPGDHLLTINNQSVTVENVLDVINQYQPGDKLILRFKTTANDTVKDTLNVVLGNREQWQGPISKREQIIAPIATDNLVPVSSTTLDLEESLTTLLQKNKLDEPIHHLFDFFKQWRDKYRGANSLAHVMYAFDYPTRLMDLENKLTSRIDTLKQNPGNLFNIISENLDIHRTSGQFSTRTEFTWQTLKLHLLLAQKQQAKAFSRFNQQELKELRSNIRYLLREISQRRLLTEQQEPLRSIHAMNASLKLDFQMLLAAAETLSPLLSAKFRIQLPDQPKAHIPSELHTAIEGEIINAEKSDGLWIIYGGHGNNRYDMSMIDIVYDPGGNDIYQYNDFNDHAVSVIIDIKGNDIYRGVDIGPAAAWLGLAFINDLEGDDQYRGTLTSNASGIFGIGVLIDHRGSDSYQGDFFSNGAGFYGTGALIDLGATGDVYDSVSFSQAFAGPAGFGLLYDKQGNDLYRANRSSPSAYGTPAVFMSFSQGVGFGIRGYDSGGIAILYDNSGSDRYEGGEFSQGGGYYWGLGILHDNEGNDLYYGNRYSQGFAAHQAVGMLVDARGDDSYWGTTAASQGAAWDVAMGLLLDKQGNDSYRADGLSQGAAAMQAMGWLMDLSGNDQYIAHKTSTQGESGNNTYHYNTEQPVYSWSLFIDNGNGLDNYSTERKNNSLKWFSELDKTRPEESRVHGLFIDTDDIFDLTTE